MKRIPYRLIKIENNEFAAFEDNVCEDGMFSIKTEFGFSVSLKQHLVKCEATFLGENSNDLPIFKLVLTCFFSIEPSTLEELIKDDVITIPVDFLRYMGTIVVGTARGYLFARTEKSNLSEYVLPPLNLMEAIKEDFVVSVSSK